MSLSLTLVATVPISNYYLRIDIYALSRDDIGIIVIDDSF